MGVYIKGMKMPESCGECNDRHIYDLMWKLGLCQGADTDDYSGCVCVGRANCPLVDLPPHGDLIDRSELAHDMEFVTSDEACPLHIAAEIDQYIAQTPTVLEAEGKDDG